MKYLSEEEKQKYQRLAQRRSEHNLLRLAKKRKDKAQETRIKEIRKVRYAEFSEPVLSLEIPHNLSLTSNYDAVVAVVQDLRYIALIRRLKVGMDFSGVRSLGAAAALYLAAEIYRCRFLQTGQTRVTGWHPTDSNAARLLKEMGFNKLLNIVDPSVAGREEEPGVHYIKYETSSSVSGRLARELRMALERGSHAIPTKARRAIFEGLTEAMTNVLHHAYPLAPDTPRRAMRGRWWMAGSINRSANELTIMFYDQGVGIPTTLPRKHAVEVWGGIISGLGLRPNDGTMIKAATMLGRTRTEEKHRGKGLQDVLETIRVSEQGELRILSNKGEYVYRSDGTDDIINHRRSIGGTLIQWRISRSPDANGDENA